MNRSIRRVRSREIRDRRRRPNRMYKSNPRLRKRRLSRIKVRTSRPPIKRPQGRKRSRDEVCAIDAEWRLCGGAETLRVLLDAETRRLATDVAYPYQRCCRQAARFRERGIVRCGNLAWGARRAPQSHAERNRVCLRDRPRGQGDQRDTGPHLESRKFLTSVRIPVVSKSLR